MQTLELNTLSPNRLIWISTLDTFDFYLSALFSSIGYTTGFQPLRVLLLNCAQMLKFPVFWLAVRNLHTPLLLVEFYKLSGIKTKVWNNLKIIKKKEIKPWSRYPPFQSFQLWFIVIDYYLMGICYVNIPNQFSKNVWYFEGSNSKFIQ